VKRNVTIPCTCSGCNARLKIEMIIEPVRTGAGGTVDCPSCGTSKLIPGEPVRISFEKDGAWVESLPHTNYLVK
jgi:hypothetical protein